MVDRYLDVERERATGGRKRHIHPVQSAASAPATPARFEATVEDPKLRETVMNAASLADPESLWSDVETEPFDVVEGDTPIVQGTGEIRIMTVQILDATGRPRMRFRTGEDLIISVTFRTTEPVERPIFGVAIFRSDGVYIHGPNTRFDGVLDGTYHGIYTYFIRWKSLALLSGRYRLSIAVFDKLHLKPHIWQNQLYDFEISSDVEDHGLIQLEHDWGLITHLEK